VFAERGYPLDRPSEEAVERATAILDVELDSELELPFPAQRRSPMELFRMALDVLSRSLADRGIEPNLPAGRGTSVDVYGLAPGSPSALGPEAHAAHLAWGTAKAAAFIGTRSSAKPEPVTIVMSGNRDDRERILASLNGRGIACRATRNPAAVVEAIDTGAVLVAVVDLAHRSSREVIATLTHESGAVVVYGDAIDDLIETGLRAQGVRAVIDRKRFLADPAQHVPGVV
jgi:hypothetical protein